MLLFDFQGLLENPFGGVAQLGEHLPCKQGVKGSNPFISTIGWKNRNHRFKERISEWGDSGDCANNTGS